MCLVWHEGIVMCVSYVCVVEFVAADPPCGNCDVLVADDVLAIDGLCCV